MSEFIREFIRLIDSAGGEITVRACPHTVEGSATAFCGCRQFPVKPPTCGYDVDAIFERYIEQNIKIQGIIMAEPDFQKLSDTILKINKNYFA